MAYLELKGEGDKSLSGNRRACQGIVGAASWDPRDMAKAGLLEVQRPAMKVHVHRKMMPETDAHVVHRHMYPAGAASSMWGTVQ